MSPKQRMALMWFAIPIVLAGLGLATYLAMNNTTAEGRGETGRPVVLLLGASVGKAWHLADFPRRASTDRYRFESVAYYEYDKSDALDEILMRPTRKFRLTRTYLKGFFRPAPRRPDVIILKECAAYFPGDADAYQALMRRWVGRIRAEGIAVVLATVVPVTPRHATEHPGRMETIRAYNEWIREYARKERLPLLDLAAALSTDGSAGFLPDELTNGDGLHLNQAAYDRLDRVLLDAVGRLESGAA